MLAMHPCNLVSSSIVWALKIDCRQSLVFLLSLSLRAQTELRGVVAPCYQLALVVLITRYHNSPQRSLSP